MLSKHFGSDIIFQPFPLDSQSSEEPGTTASQTTV